MIKDEEKKKTEATEKPDGSYSISDIQYYFECIVNKYETLTNNYPVKLNIKKNENKLR